MKKQELEGRPGKPENLTATMHPISPAESPKLLVIGDIRYKDDNRSREVGYVTLRRNALLNNLFSHFEDT